jgi:hypothetical protein
VDKAFSKYKKCEAKAAVSTGFGAEGVVLSIHADAFSGAGAQWRRRLPA